MRYTYAYKTSDGTRHEAAIEATSREAVFEQLRSKGIKAIKVVAADGSKANGEVRGVRKRIVAALVVLVAASVGVVAYRGGTRSVASPGDGGRGAAALPFLTDRTRRQVIGDAAVVEKGIRTGWADVFPDEGDRFLASFAIPGVKAGVGTTSIAALEDALKERSPRRGDPTTAQDGGATSVKSPLGIEARQIIAMVEGMKAEARDYLAAGGTVVEYGRRLTERQDAEIAVYRRVESEVLAAYERLRQSPSPASESAFTRLYDRRNDELRNLGIRPVTLPD